MGRREGSWAGWRRVAMPAVLCGTVTVGLVAPGSIDEAAGASDDQQRLVLPDYGVAVSFPADWLVERATPDRHAWLFSDPEVEPAFIGLALWTSRQGGRAAWRCPSWASSSRATTP
jgi:hypothetical protein